MFDYVPPASTKWQTQSVINFANALLRPVFGFNLHIGRPIDVRCPHIITVKRASGRLCLWDVGQAHLVFIVLNSHRKTGGGGWGTISSGPDSAFNVLSA